MRAHDKAAKKTTLVCRFAAVYWLDIFIYNTHHTYICIHYAQRADKMNNVLIVIIFLVVFLLPASVGVHRIKLLGLHSDLLFHWLRQQCCRIRWNNLQVSSQCTCYNNKSAVFLHMIVDSGHTPHLFFSSLNQGDIEMNSTHIFAYYTLRKKSAIRHFLCI